MAYTKYSLTPANNNAAPPDGAPEGMLPSAVNDTMRDMMAQIRDCGDGIRGGTYTMTAPVITGGSISGSTMSSNVITGGSINNTPIGASTANTGAFTTLSASSTVSGTGFSNYFASPPALGGTAAAAVSSTNLSYTGTLTGGTGVVNLGSGQFYKDASGNIGVGTSSPQAKLQVLDQIKVSNSAQSQGAVVLGDGGSTAFNVGIARWNGSTNAAGAGGVGYFAQGTGNSGGHYWYTGDAAAGSQTERMRITSAGSVLVGCTATPSSSVSGVEIFNPLGTPTKFSVGTATSGINQISFYNGNGNVGNISTSGSATTYATSSDYRLKENIAPMTGALARVSELKPVTYSWRVDGSHGEGFIAHELQAVVPDCVTGEKDATRIEQYEISPAIPATFDEEGNELTPAVEAVMGEREVPVYQGIDTSFLIATLTASIQELHAIVKAQDARIKVLEAK